MDSPRHMLFQSWKSYVSRLMIHRFSTLVSRVHSRQISLSLVVIVAVSQISETTHDQGYSRERKMRTEHARTSGRHILRHLNDSRYPSYRRLLQCFRYLKNFLLLHFSDVSNKLITLSDIRSLLEIPSQERFTHSLLISLNVFRGSSCCSE